MQKVENAVRAGYPRPSQWGGGLQWARIAYSPVHSLHFNCFIPFQAKSNGMYKVRVFIRDYDVRRSGGSGA